MNTLTSQSISTNDAPKGPVTWNPARFTDMLHLRLRLQSCHLRCYYNPNEHTNSLRAHPLPCQASGANIIINIGSYALDMECFNGLVTFVIIAFSDLTINGNNLKVKWINTKNNIGFWFKKSSLDYNKKDLQYQPRHITMDLICNIQYMIPNRR